MVKWFSHWREAWHVLDKGMPEPVKFTVPVEHECPPAPYEEAIRRLIQSDAFDCALWAVEKIKRQKKLEALGNHIRKEEATEWGNTYGREVLGKSPDTWELRFLIEFVIGIEKGRLPQRTRLPRP